MSPVPSKPPEDASEIAENIRSGEFFRESLQDYHARYSDIISERYFYLAVMLISIFLLMLSLISITMLHPLSSEVPFVYSTEDIVEDLPRMKQLGGSQADPNVVLKQFLLANYVKLREGYSIETVDRNANGIKSQSTDDVYNAYQASMDPSNPESPIAQFQRQATRQVEVGGFQNVKVGVEETVNVNFTAMIITSDGIKKNPMRAIISFRFKEIEVDRKTGDVFPHGFIVTQYKTESLGI